MVAENTLTRVASLTLKQRKASPGGAQRFSATLSTETPVARRSRDGESYNEVLSHKPGAVSFRQNPLPLIESHDASKVNIGVVTNLRVEGAKLKGDVVFGMSARAQELAADAAAGILTSLSIGYAVEATTQSADRRTVTVTKFTIHEVSLVSLPADVNAGIGRSFNPNGVAKMETTETTVDLATRERERIAGIKNACSVARLEPEIEAQLIRDGVSLEAAKNQVLELMAARSDAISTTQHVTEPTSTRSYTGRIQMGETADEKFIKGASAQLFERAGNGLIERAVKMNVKGFSKSDLDPGEFRGMSLPDLARLSLERKGVRTRGMSSMQMVGAALTHRAGGYSAAGDFPILLESALNKTLLAAYATQADTWSRFCKIEMVPDFRNQPRYRTGSFGTLDSVAEGGEFKNKSIPDGNKSTLGLSTKGNIIAIGRQTIINDDMSALSDLAVKMGRAARLSIEQDVYALLTANSGLGATQSDTNPFFHSSRANVNATGSALSVAGIDADRVVMAQQLDISSNDYLDLRPSILLVPVALGGQARVLNSSAFNHDSTKLQQPNMVQGLFTDVIDTPRLTGTRRYLLASPDVAAAIVVTFLEGQGQAPMLESQDGWRVDGTEFKCRLDYKAQTFDPKGAVTNAGV